MATDRFHINPETGNANICRAKTPERCHFADQVHYDSRAEAQAAYEESQAEFLFAGASLKEGVLGKNGYLRKDYAALAAPRGVACPRCGRQADHIAGSLLISNEYAKCPCGMRYDLDDAKVEILPGNDSHRFLQAEEVLKATWYHATSEERWLDEIQDTGMPFEAHMGTESAAFDRALTEYVPHGSWNRKEFYLYEVSLDPASRIMPDVARDENSRVLKDESYDVARYINLWEDMASISLAVRPERLIIKSRRTVTRETAHRRISLYNVAPPTP